MSLCDVLGLVGYWSETPPAHVVLAARYLDRGKGRSMAQLESPENEAEFMKMAAMVGAPKPAPAYAKKALAWAEAVTAPKTARKQ